MSNCPKCGIENNETGKFCSQCGTALFSGDALAITITAKNSMLPGIDVPHEIGDPRRAILPNEMFADNYRIIARIGEGGMGVVYKAEDTRLNRTVALKFVKDWHSQSTSLRSRLVQEARAAASLMHPNIAAVFELGQTDEAEFIVMEYIDGVTLKEEIRKRPLSIAEVLAIFEQICDGLSNAHDKGIVHRDIKSANIMLTKDHRVKITDFGLAHLPQGEELTQAGMALGTLPYMAPEQMAGQSSNCLTDIWSVGVVLYEMLTGKLPFEGSGWVAMINAVNNDRPKSISQFRSDVPHWLELLVFQLLEKNPELRISELGELKNASIVYGEKTASLEVHPAGRGQRRPSVAVLPFVNRSSDPEKEFFSAGLADELISALAATNNLHVVARSSSFSFQGQDLDIRDVGRKLDVETIIEGSVRWSVKRLRITVQAVNVLTGFQIWSQVFDRELDDIFDIQEETAMAIVERLHGQLETHEKAQLKQRPTESVEAYEYYLQGRYFLNSMDPTLFKKGMQLQELAIAEDPDFQLAHVAIAEAFCLMAEWDIQPALEAYPQALKWADRALKINEANAETHACLGSIHTHFTWDWPAAEKHLRRAIELNVNLAMAHDRFAEFLRYTGHCDEAIAEALQARDLDPLAPSTNWTLAATLDMCGQTQRALVLAEKNVAMFPNLAIMYFLLALVQERLDQDMEAERTLLAGMEIAGPLPEHLCLLGFLYGKTGQPDKAENCLDQLTDLSKTRYVTEFAYAVIYAGLRQADPMFEHLEKTYQSRGWQVVLIGIFRMFDFARDDPRFKALLQEIGLLDS